MKVIKKRIRSRTGSQKRPVQTTKSRNSSSSRTESRRRASDYPIVVRFIDGYVVVSAPDFQFPVPALKRLDLENPNLRTIGEMVYMTHLQIAAELKERDSAGIPHPHPSKPRDTVPRAARAMSLAEAARELGLRPHVIRAMADSGEIRATRTPGGHRRFLRESVEAWLGRSTRPGTAQAES